jgi:hypothetical protein
MLVSASTGVRQRTGAVTALGTERALGLHVTAALLHAVAGAAWLYALLVHATRGIPLLWCGAAVDATDAPRDLPLLLVLCLFRTGVVSVAVILPVCKKEWGVSASVSGSCNKRTQGQIGRKLGKYIDRWKSKYVC